MNYERTTHVPNSFFDEYLPTLTLAELKILLIIIRQTNGWIDKRTGTRKIRDRITHSQFCQKANLSRRILSLTLQPLVNKGLIEVTDYSGKPLRSAQQRKGKQYLYYEATLRPVQIDSGTSAIPSSEPVQKSAYNKTKKNNKTKIAQYTKAILEIIESVKRSMLTDDIT